MKAITISFTWFNSTVKHILNIELVPPKIIDSLVCQVIMNLLCHSISVSNVCVIISNIDLFYHSTKVKHCDFVYYFHVLVHNVYYFVL